MSGSVAMRRRPFFPGQSHKLTQVTVCLHPQVLQGTITEDGEISASLFSLMFRVEHFATL